MIGARRPYSSQMHSSHQDARGGVLKEKSRTYHKCCETVQADSSETLHLPPSCVGDPPGVHLSHVTHPDDAHHCVAHFDDWRASRSAYVPCARESLLARWCARSDSGVVMDVSRADMGKKNEQRAYV